jgi:hypothetical protein
LRRNTCPFANRFDLLELGGLNPPAWLSNRPSAARFASVLKTRPSHLLLFGINNLGSS